MNTVDTGFNAIPEPSRAFQNLSDSNENSLALTPITRQSQQSFLSSQHISIVRCFSIQGWASVSPMVLGVMRDPAGWSTMKQTSILKIPSIFTSQTIQGDRDLPHTLSMMVCLPSQCVRNCTTGCMAACRNLMA